jgi:hypothetical protein
MKALLIILLAMSAAAFADCQQDRRDFYHNQKVEWKDQCGEYPDAEYLAKLKLDCSATAQRIEGRAGASWNSEYGWAFDSTCEALERGDEL